MAYTVTQLITDAYYLSGLVSRRFQTVSGFQLNEGLNSLNAIISFKTAQQRLIPYFQEYDFNLVVGEQNYFIDNLIKPETFVFYIGDIRYPTVQVGRNDFFATARVENIDSLPFQWHFERTLNGGTIYLYFKPQDTYAATLWGKFSLDTVTLNQDLSLTLDQFYIEYLRYATAQRLCQENNISFPPDSKQTLDEYEELIKNISPVDFYSKKFSFFAGSGGLTWADVNIGRGWRPP
jgi:hypothetical protein